MADIRINDLPLEANPNSSDFLAIDGAATKKATIQKVVDSGAPVSSESEAQAGTNNSKRMTPLTTKQSIASEVGVSIASQANGALAATAVQPNRQIISGQGLIGGGNLSSDVTINVGAGTGISVDDNSVSIDALTQSRLIPSGGSTGQALVKTSSSDYSVGWSNAGSGDVVGPLSSTDGYLAAFNGASGKLLKQQILSTFASTILDDVSGTAMFSTMGATFSGSAASGSARFPNGLELKWGSSFNSDFNYRVIFPVAFANDCFLPLPINTFDYGGASDRFIGASTSNVDKNGFDMRVRIMTNGGSVTGQGNAPIRWFAIGW